MSTPTHGLPADRALTLSDFEQLPSGTEVTLYYNDTNRGAFAWRHDRVEGDRVWGAFRYDDMNEWTDVEDFLYEFCGEVCRGSGAEPVWAGDFPPDPA